MKVCVVGAGAIGGYVGALFAQAGHEVSLLARGEHLEALRKNGITLQSQGRTETSKVEAAADPAAFGVQDVVFIGLKAYSIAAMLARMAPLIGADTMVVPAINGLPWWYFHREGGALDGSCIECLDPHGEMFALLDPRHVIGCVVHAAAQVTAPGVITHTAGRAFMIGEPDRSNSPRLQRLAAAMRGAGLETVADRDIREEVWMKLIGNLSYNPVAALTLAHMHEINANEALLSMIRLMMEESMRVAAAYGVRVTVSIEERIAIARTIGNAKISMHQDIDKGRPLETDAIVGSVLELARKAGIAMPMTGALHALLAERARH